MHRDTSISNPSGTEPDPRRCADIRYFSMDGSGIYCRCKYFWWDYGPLDEISCEHKFYTNIACCCSGKLEHITMGIIKHTSNRGCCMWKPEFEATENPNA